MTPRLHPDHQEQARPFRVAQRHGRAVPGDPLKFLCDPFHGFNISAGEGARHD